jgi:hypothetical protein
MSSSSSSSTAAAGTAGTPEGSAATPGAAASSVFLPFLGAAKQDIVFEDAFCQLVGFMVCIGTYMGWRSLDCAVLGMLVDLPRRRRIAESKERKKEEGSKRAQQQSKTQDKTKDVVCRDIGNVVEDGMWKACWSALC